MGSMIVWFGWLLFLLFHLLAPHLPLSPTDKYNDDAAVLAGGVVKGGKGGMTKCAFIHEVR